MQPNEAEGPIFQQSGFLFFFLLQRQGIQLNDAIASKLLRGRDANVDSSSVRQPIFKVACQLTHVGCVAESLQFVFCGFDVDAQALADLVLHLEHSR